MEIAARADSHLAHAKKLNLVCHIVYDLSENMRIVAAQSLRNDAKACCGHSLTLENDAKACCGHFQALENDAKAHCGHFQALENDAKACCGHFQALGNDTKAYCGHFQALDRFANVRWQSDRITIVPLYTVYKLTVLYNLLGQAIFLY